MTCQSQPWSKRTRIALSIFTLLLLLPLGNCSNSESTSDQTPELVEAPTINLFESTAAAVGKTQTPTEEAAPQASSTPTPSPTRSTSIGGAWQEAPVIPVVDPGLEQVFNLGQSLGNNPNAFSKIGDSETFTTWFLAPFDQEPATYNLGPYTDLKHVIDYFQGSYARQSLASRQGFNAASVFAPLWADPTQCQPGETPLACEYRVHRPSFVFILLGTNDYLHLDAFEGQMRKIITTSLEMGVIPILGTKADNLEGDGTINETIFKLSQEFQIPLWNFWLAVQGLPENGLDTDGAHLTYGLNDFGDPGSMQRAWPVRNLTALQALDAVWRVIVPPTPIP